jgi:hypothetical protein
MLDDYPLFLVGADYNQAALKVTQANLIKADIHLKLFGEGVVPMTCYRMT